MNAVASDGVPLSYTVTGAGPDVVLIHGTTATRAVWNPQIDALAERYRVICMDLRGAGESGVPEDESAYSVGQMARDVASVLDAVDAGRAHVGGISIGGGVALRFALDHPERTASLHMTGAWARTDEFLRRIFFEPMRRGLASGDTRTTFRYGVGLMMSPPYLETRGPQDVAELITEVFVRKPVAKAGFAGHLCAGERHDESARLSEVRVPTLVMTGELDANVPPRYARELAEGIPGAQTRVFRGSRAAHCPNIEMPGEFNAAVLSFLDRHTSGARS